MAPSSAVRATSMRSSRRMRRLLGHQSFEEFRAVRGWTKDGFVIKHARRMNEDGLEIKYLFFSEWFNVSYVRW